MNYILYAIYAALIIGPIYLVWAIVNINKKMRKVEWLNSQDFTTLRIGVPKNNDKSPLAAEQMFAAIHGIYSESAEFQSYLSFEIVAKDKFLQFYIHLPVHLKDFVEGQIYAQYPAVEIKEVEDYAGNTDISAKNFAICELGLNKPDVYPIKQFSDFEVDPISGITSVMSKLNSGEEIWFQLVISPIGDNWQEKGHAMVNAVRSGVKPGAKGVSNKFMKGLLGFLRAVVIQAITPGADTTVPAKEVKLPGSVEEALKNIEQKITKLGFGTKIRILALGDDPVSTRLKCQSVGAAFKQYNTTNLNGFRVSEISMNDQDEWKDFATRSYNHDGNIFNISELASIFHLPHSSVSTPNIVWSGSKKGEPPANLPIRENVPPEDYTVIGYSNFRNEFHEFGMKTDDRRRHVYIIGKSGVGKSTLIENMAIDDVYAGRGIITVDPHGELAEKVLSCIPPERMQDVIVFDPSDREYPIAFNLLETVNDDFKGLVASGFVGIFKKIFGDSWGPRLEHILRNTVLALLDFEGSTMLDIPRMLTNNRFREKVVAVVKDPVIKEFWENEFAAYDAKFRTEAVSPILNKVGQFLSTSTIRNIVGQTKSSLNIREVMDQKKILLVNLSRGKIGEDNSALLGAMMITKIQLAAMSRADVEASQRPDCFLYVDEFQNFATDSFATILSEARKYNLSLTMAHQYIAQMDPKVCDAVFGNAGTIASFRVGGADAAALVKEYSPVFDENDLVNLDKYHIYIKLLIDGIASPAFSARTLPPVAKISGLREQVLTLSRDRYASPRHLVENDIFNRGKLEEEELRREAEIFKSGGLEALLLKKEGSGGTYHQPQKFTPAPQAAPAVRPPAQSPSSADVSIPAPKVLEQPIQPVIVQETSNNDLAPSVLEMGNPPPLAVDQTQSDTGQQSDQAELVQTIKKNEEPRLVKYQNILDGRIYKERTARGGVKWYLGEDFDEEKLTKSGLIVDDNARKLVEVTAELSAKSGGVQPKNETEKAVRNPAAGSFAAKQVPTTDSTPKQNKNETQPQHNLSFAEQGSGQTIATIPNNSVQENIIPAGDKSVPTSSINPIVSNQNNTVAIVEKEEILPMVQEEIVPVVASDLPTTPVGLQENKPVQIEHHANYQQTIPTNQQSGGVAPQNWQNNNQNNAIYSSAGANHLNEGESAQISE